MIAHDASVKQTYISNGPKHEEIKASLGGREEGSLLTERGGQRIRLLARDGADRQKK